MLLSLKSDLEAETFKMNKDKNCAPLEVIIILAKSD